MAPAAKLRASAGRQTGQEVKRGSGAWVWCWQGLSSRSWQAACRLLGCCSAKADEYLGWHEGEKGCFFVGGWALADGGGWGWGIGGFRARHRTAWQPDLRVSGAPMLAQARTKTWLRASSAQAETLLLLNALNGRCYWQVRACMAGVEHPG